MRRRRMVVGALAALVGVGVLGYQLPGQPADAAAAQPAGPEQVVTLVTGDKVAVRPDGKTWQVRVEPRAGRRTGFLQSVGPGGVTVIPADVAQLVRDGKLDRALFDVTGLIARGLADGKSTTLPLLVQTDGRRSAGTLGRMTRQLANLAAVSAPKGRALDELPAGIKRVWLNGRAKPTLDVSVPQVGAPAAWQAGHSGKGAKIAVLDTGYDAAHPDLQGAVAASKDFTGEGIQDEVGHGTHVASIAAGRGTASKGKYTGVAKDAGLLIGKVCTWEGCSWDAIIAGMQWAADSGAKVVNLSLGGDASDGTDLLSTELNRISAASGALFVVSAGNAGPTGRVSSPAAADRALAVGSVTKQDELSEFSSVGPRAGDFGLKPDIAAPGSDIVAARAKGTPDDDAVDENYARLSGTSMAAPHVTGAAAILAAQHVDWTGERLKAILMSSAQPLDGISVFAQGAGRLDVARADRQQVVTDAAALQFGRLVWPHADREPIARKVIFRNLGTTAVTLATQLDVPDVPAGFAKVDAATLTVPAGGQAVATVTIDPKLGRLGTFEGRLVARSADGSVVVQTPFGVHKEEESFDFELKVIDRNGAVLPATGSSATARILNLDRPEIDLFPVEPGEKLRLPKGRYQVGAYVYTANAGYALPSVTAYAQPELSLDSDRVLTIDARPGKPVRHHVDRPGRTNGTFAMVTTTAAGRSTLSSWFAERSFAVPTSGSSADLGFLDGSSTEADAVVITDQRGTTMPVDWASGDDARFIGSRKLRTVNVGHATDADLAQVDVKGKLAMFTLDVNEVGDYAARVQRLAELGAAATLNYLTDENAWPGDEPSIPSVVADGPGIRRLVANAGSWATLTGRPQSPYRYDVLFGHRGGIPAAMDRRIRDRDLITEQTAYHGNQGEAVSVLPIGSAGDLGRLGIQWAEQIRLPLQRTVLRSAAPITWTDEMLTDTARYRSEVLDRGPGRISTAWLAPVTGPAPAAEAIRDGDGLSIRLPLVSDGAGHAASASNEGYEGSTTLWRGDQQIAHSDRPGDPLTTEVGAEQATYRLVATARRTGQPTQVSAEWTLRSGRTAAAQPLPLVTVGLQPPVRLDNTAPGGRTFRIPVTARQSATVESVEYSTDNGKTWTNAVLANGVATIRHPATGWISLRSSAKDADGNKVVQTTLAAYQVR
ncbi:S8 family serine peptidase [Kribbella sp. NPDC056951]|uniref:S8 family serine peptidase n=1 Tax=Kribbella sp. NPDC056951 TaxID=3345978 RepID=UPI00363B1C27